MKEVKKSKKWKEVIACDVSPVAMFKSIIQKSLFFSQFPKHWEIFQSHNSGIHINASNWRFRRILKCFSSIGHYVAPSWQLQLDLIARYMAVLNSRSDLYKKLTKKKTKDKAHPLLILHVPWNTVWLVSNTSRIVHGIQI